MAGAIKDNKIYGDETALRRLADTGTKQGNEELVPRIARPVGRPGTGAGYRGVPQTSTPAIDEPESPYQSLYENFGLTARVAQVASMFANDPLAGPWLRRYAEYATDDAMKAGREIRNSTPFIDED